ncbi:MAG: tetratricopeptide repeat protein [Bacteroidota bacterium]
MYTLDARQTLTYGQEAVNLAQELQFERGLVRAFSVMGIGFMTQGNNQRALEHFLMASQKAEELQMTSAHHGPINNIGLIYAQWRNEDKALLYFFEASAMARETQDKRALSVYLSNIGFMYLKQKKYDAALDYFNRALNMRESSHSQIHMPQLMLNIGLVYLATGKKTLALSTYEDAYQLALEINDKLGQTQILNSIGDLYLEDNQTEKARNTLEKALEIAREIDNQEVLSDCLISMSNFYLKSKRYRQALVYNNKNILIAQSANLRHNLEKIYEIYAEGYAGIGDYQSALEYHKRFKTETDSSHTREKERYLAEVAIQYDIEKSETENEFLKKQQSKNEMMIRERGYLIVAIAVILLLVSYLAFVLSRINSRRKIYGRNLKKEVERQTKDIERSHKMLKESYEELERFAYIASHDLKEPLRNISSFTKLIERRIGHHHDNKLKEYLGFIVKNTHQMNTLIVDVLEYSKLRNKSKLNKEVDLNEMLPLVVQSIHSSIREHGAQVVATDLPTVHANYSQLFLVFKNLIVNGIKYNNSPNPKIIIRSELLDGEHFFYVRDNGIGIYKEYHQQIFIMFKRLHTRQLYKGSGLGLAICKKAINQMNGNIWVESQENEGSTFIFTLPIKERQPQNSMHIIQALEMEEAAIDEAF